MAENVINWPNVAGFGDMEKVTAVGVVGAAVATPLSATNWVACVFSESSLRTNPPDMGPAAVGTKLIARSHEAPAANVAPEFALESVTGQPDPPLLFNWKSAEMLGFVPALGIANVSGSLPMFSVKQFVDYRSCRSDLGRCELQRRRIGYRELHHVAVRVVHQKDVPAGI